MDIGQFLWHVAINTCVSR